MPAPRSKILTRATYARTPNSFLVNDPDGFPSDFPPAMWWFGTDSGGGAYPIGPNGPWSVESMAAAQPVVIRATALITGPLTAAPFRVMDSAVAGQPLGTPRWLSDPMLVRPDTRFGKALYPDVQRLVRSVFWTSWLRSAIWFGLGAFIYELDQAGGPMAGTLRLLNPLALSTTDAPPDGTAGWRWQLADGPVPAVFDRDGVIDLGPISYRLCVLRNPHSPVDQQGMSQGVFAMAPSAFRLAGQIDAYTGGQFRAGVPNGYLKTSTPGMTQPAADALKAAWLKNHGGDRRSIAVLNSTTEFVPINLSPVDAALDQVKRLNVADVAFAFGLDPMTLGAGLNNSATYSNLRDAWQNHRDFGLAPWIAAAQDTLSALMPGSQSVAVNLDGFANPAASERFATYQTAIAAGVLTVDEARALEGLPPLPPTQSEVVP